MVNFLNNICVLRTQLQHNDYKKCCVEISTNGGKTLICYMLFKYLRDVISIKHILYVTPKTNLTTQAGEKFFEYDSVCGMDSNWTSEYIHGAVMLIHRMLLADSSHMLDKNIQTHLLIYL